MQIEFSALFVWICINVKVIATAFVSNFSTNVSANNILLCCTLSLPLLFAEECKHCPKGSQ